MAKNKPETDRKPDLNAEDRADLATFAVDYPDSAPGSAADWADEGPAGPRWRRRLARMGRDPRLWFLLAMAVVFAAGFWLRFWRLDMPPFDYPADRQRSNIYAVECFLRGDPLLKSLAPFHELALYPWLIAKTYPKSLCEPYTWARIWSLFWGMMMVAAAAVVGYWSVAGARISPARRWWFAFLFMAAIAFNPYHIGLSRITMTEPMTLAFQTIALGFFLMAMARPQRIYTHIGFVVFFALMGLGKIPSLVWAPAFALGYGFNPKISKRARLIALGAMALGLCLVFLIYQLNPFTMIQTYAQNYGPHFKNIVDWFDHELWYKTYFTRLAVMITIPGLLFGLVGMVVAPWVYRVTMAFALVAFYFLTGQNTYNFCHLILPGAALAIFGLNFIVEAGSRRHLALGARAQEATPRPFTRFHQAWGAAIVIVVMAVFLPFQPDNHLDAEPAETYRQALRIVQQYVPRDAMLLMNDDIFSYYLSTYEGRESKKREALDLSTGWFYSFNRLTAAHDISRSWVKWASLPGEIGSLLLTNKPGIMDEAEQARYVKLSKNPGAPVVEGLDLEAVLLPADHIDGRQRVLKVTPGETVSIGLQWNNTGDYHLARVVSRLGEWGQHFFPPPIREGGMIKGRGDLLCVPMQGRQVVRYTFEFPKNYPGGQYQLLYYPITEEDATNDIGTVKAYGLPVVIEVAKGAPAGPVVERRALDLYPDLYIWENMGWNDARRYKDMELVSLTMAGRVSRVIPCAGSPAGKYRLTLTGSGTPIFGDDPKNLWPEVDVFLPDNPATPIATVPFASEKTAAFSVEFTAARPFDSVMLGIRTRGATAGRTPFWLIGFEKDTTYGPAALQYINMRTVKLERMK